MGWFIFLDPTKVTIPSRILDHADKMMTILNLSNEEWTTLDIYIYNNFTLTDNEVVNEGANTNSILRPVVSDIMKYEEVSMYTTQYLNGRFSVQLQLNIPQHIIESVDNAFDNSLIPIDSGSQQLLVDRMSESSHLDEMVPFYPTGTLMR